MSLLLPYRLTGFRHCAGLVVSCKLIVLNKHCRFHCYMLKCYSCFLKAGNGTELVHTEGVVRLCARAGLSERNLPVATSAVRMHWQNIALLNHKTRRFKLNEDFQIELEFIQAGSRHPVGATNSVTQRESPSGRIGGPGGHDGTPAHKNERKDLDRKWPTTS